MLFLTTGSDLFSLVTSGATSVDYSAGWVDLSATGAVSGSSVGNIVAATATTVVPATGSVTVNRQLKSLTVVNKDASATQTITLNKSSSGTFAVFRNCPLLPGESLVYIDSIGFIVLNANGLSKAVVTGGGGGGSYTPNSLVNLQTGTSYTIADGDRSKLISFTNVAAVAVALPQAGASSNFIAGWFIDVQNRGAGTLTITPTTSTIDGASSFALATAQGVRIFSDGTNYFTQRGVGGASGGSFTGGTLTSALNEAPPITIASSTTPAIFAAAANTINITGTTTITGFDTIAAGAIRRIIFSAALQLTNSASLQNVTGANMLTAAGDIAEFESLGSGNARMVAYQRNNGTTLIGDTGSPGRLTLTSGAPVPTADVTGATTVYWTPYKGNQIRLWDGSTWTAVTAGEISLALGTLTAALCYDVFMWSNAGVATLEFSAWTNATTRATIITLQDGRWCKSGDKTRLYLGTFYTTSTTTTEDSGGGSTSQVGGKRFLWNNYNRVVRHALVIDTTANWSYTTDVIRQANAAAGNKVECVVGISEDSVDVTAAGDAYLISNTRAAKIGIGLDSTTAFSGTRQGGINGGTNGLYSAVTGQYRGQLSAGYHYLAWLEKGADVTCAFLGNNGGDGQQTGLLASLFT